MGLQLSGMTTLAQRMERSGSHSTGFDYMRLLLALGVVLWHTVVICYGNAFQNALWVGPYRALFSFILPMFFALSGFLVCGSLERCRTLVSFLSLRILRIFPALVAEVLLSALLLGPILTEASRSDYFHSETLYSYFLNMLGDIHYVLPGLFDRNPLPGVVNGQLWTVPYELQCYIALALLSLLTVFRKTVVFLGILCVYQIFLIALLFIKPDIVWIGLQGPELILYFLAGVAFYRFRRVIVWHGGFAVAALAASLGLLSLNGGSFLAALPLTYLTVWLGLLSPKTPAFLKSGDYSYGVYLYSFPIQQAVALMAWTRVWYINALISLPLACLAAVASWHLLEKHVLRHKKLAYALEDSVLALRNKLARPKAPGSNAAIE